MYLIAKASPELRFLVDYFWELDTAVSNRDVTEYMFAYPHTNLVFNIREGYLKDDVKEGQVKVETDKLIGPRILPVGYRHLNNNKLFGIKLSIGGLALLTKISSVELVNETPEIRYINRVLYDALVSKVIENYRSFNTAIKITEEILMAKISLQQYNDVLSIQAMTTFMVSKAPYSLHVSELTEFTGYHIKTIERIFERTVGIMPKTFFNQIRCEAAIRGMLSGNPNWSYFDYGFTDQAHFIKQVRKYSQCSPTQLKKLLAATSCQTVIIKNEFTIS